jgi:hypothetical protein
MHPRDQYTYIKESHQLPPPHRGVRNNTGVLVVAILFSVLISGLFIASYGDLTAVAAVLALGLILGVTIYRLDWGFFILISLVLLIDQYQIPGFETSSAQIPYFKNLKEIGAFQNVGIAVLNPFELHLFFLVLIWVSLLALQRKIIVRHVRVWVSALFFVACVGFSFIYGMRSGGDFLVALWELRALCYFMILFFFVPQIIQTKKQVRNLMWIVIITISVKAFEGLIRFIGLGFHFNGIPALTNHEDPVFITTLIIFLLGLVLFGGHRAQKRILQILLVVLAAGFYTAQRRAAYGAFVVSLITFLILAGKKELFRYLRYVVIAIVVLALYAGIFWNSEGRLGAPIQLLKTSLSNTPETAGDRYYSNLYREYERYDLAQTIQRTPIKGIGFGNMYDQTIYLKDMPMSFSLRDFIPHNEILWLLTKMGSIGFFSFCLFFTSYAFQGSILFVRLKDPYFKAVLAVAIIAGLNQIFVSYFDLQLTYYRNMIFLGTIMGLLPTLEAADKEPAAVKVTPSDH